MESWKSNWNGSGNVGVIVVSKDKWEKAFQTENWRSKSSETVKGWVHLLDCGPENGFSTGPAMTNMKTFPHDGFPVYNPRRTSREVWQFRTGPSNEVTK